MIHLYTGNGKGKTTAALGMALRAAGAGMKVFIAQFVKGMEYAEIPLVREHIPAIHIQQFGRDCFIVHEPEEADIEAARQGLREVEKQLSEGNYDMLILDEACIALHYRLFSSRELLDVIAEADDKTEIVITGRYAPPELITAADLVTEMKEIKHYYQKGIEARKGIEY